MALSCSTSVAQLDPFEFIDCSTINITYAQTGEANISLTVVSTYSNLNNDYTNLVFGGVRYTGWIVDVNLSKIPGTLVNLYNITYKAFGC